MTRPILRSFRRKMLAQLLQAGCVLLTIGPALLGQAAEPQPSPVTSPDAAQRLFESLGVDRAWFNRLHDNAVVSEAEIDVLLRMLYRLRVFPTSDMERWANDARLLPAAQQDPAVHRGQIYRLRGIVTDIEPVRPSADMVQRYEMPRYFRCRMELNDPLPGTAEIFVEKIPADWERNFKPDARGGAVAALAKTAKNKNGEDFLIFVAPRLAWYPETSLGNLGMDVGLLDTVQDQKLVLATEAGAFYQLLAAVGRAEPGQLLREADQQLSSLPAAWRQKNSQGEEQYSVVPLFNEPVSQRGRLVALSGTVRRIERIPIENPEMQRQAGSTHYYQLSLFTDDSSGNPLTFCVRELPAGMSYSSAPGYAERVRIAGFFFKTWSYRVPKLADPSLSPGDPKTSRLLSPLLIGRSLLWHAAPSPADTSAWSIVVAVFFFVFMLGIWVMAWRNRHHQQQLLAELTAAPRDLGLAGDLLSPGDAPPGTIPDFDRIEQLDQGTTHPGGPNV